MQAEVRYRKDRPKRRAASLALAMAVVGIAAILTASTAGAAPTPFSQCPAIGADTKCGTLITINPDGSATVTTSGQPPYDLSEDTLIGVQNNSSRTLANLPLKGTTAPFGFDGDGLCTASGAPAGCPFGPTGYEGPHTSFSNISTDLNSGTVNFTGGLAPTKSAYFSLEGDVGANLHVGPPPGNIFEVTFEQCKFLHVGYNRFPNGTVVHWNVTTNGVGTVATGQFTAIGCGALGSKTYHFFTVPLGTTLPNEASGIQSHVHFHWANGGNYAATRDPGC